MSSGWAVNVKESPSDDFESSKTYYARVADRHHAAEAVRRHLAAARGNTIEARVPIQSTVFDALGIPDGEVVLKTRVSTRGN